MAPWSPTRTAGLFAFPMSMSEEISARDFGRLESKVDQIIAALPQHDQRIAVLEAWKSYTTGALAVLAGAVVVLGWFVTTLISLVP